MNPLPVVPVHRDDDIVMLGVDFSAAALAARERLSYDDAQAAELLRDLTAGGGVAEAVLVSTCNRTELYFVGSPQQVPTVLARLRAGRQGPPPSEGGCILQHVTGEAAVRHLFGVASGIHSLLLGDAFILKQLKHALALAGRAGSLGSMMSETFRRAFDVGRIARATTDVARGESGLGAAVAAAISRTGEPPRLLLVGAGVTARDIARQIAKRRVGPLTIVNRTDERARALACDCQAHYRPWSELADAVRAADTVICATGARMPIITPERFGTHRPLIVDVGVPRNVEPPPGATCLVIDDLLARQDETRRRREGAVPAVRTLIDDAVSAWHAWRDARGIDHVLQRVFAQDRDARHALATEMVARGWQGSVEEAERWLGRWTSGVLKGHAADLRQWALVGRSGNGAGLDPRPSDMRTR